MPLEDHLQRIEKEFESYLQENEDVSDEVWWIELWCAKLKVQSCLRHLNKKMEE